MKLLIKFPSRGRPEQFKSVLKKYINGLSKKHEVKFVFSFDEDDASMNNPDMINHINKLDIVSKYYFGKSTNKIQAINADLENEVFDILILASDDMIPVVSDYDDEIVKKFESSGLGLDCIIHTHTARWSDILDINCIMGRDYYKRFNYIYHPEYKSIFADNEYTDVSKMLKRNVFTPNFCPFRHEWKGGDKTEIKNHNFNHEDYKVFELRKKINYGIVL